MTASPPLPPFFSPLLFSPGEATISLDKFKYLFSTTNLYWEQPKV